MVRVKPFFKRSDEDSNSGMNRDTHAWSWCHPSSKPGFLFFSDKEHINKQVAQGTGKQLYFFRTEESYICDNTENTINYTHHAHI